MNDLPESALAHSAIPPVVTCVVVNWNGWQDTIACLESLQRQDYPALKVIVVDNGSTDDSCRIIRETHPWVTLIETGTNLGFPGGCNAGTRLALQQGADYIWLLNNDTTLPDDTTSKLIQTALDHPRAGAIGAVLYFMYDHEKVQAWGGGAVNLWTGYVSHITQPTAMTGNAYLTGAAMLLPRKICEEVGLLYEGYFMYCDDSDLCLRIHRAGYPLIVCDQTEILHKEGGSSSKRSPLMDRFATTSCLRLLKRHAPVPAISIAIYLLLRFANRLVRLEGGNLAAVWEGILVFWKERRIQFTDRI
jgi:GT2 family glycosyltransferase